MKHLLLILAVSVFFRFLYLGVIPVSLSHDETDSIIQAHAVIQTGRDIVGSWSPFSLLPNSGVMAELAPLIHVPALLILPNSLFSAHFTNALLGSFLPLLVWYWLSLLKTKRRVALFAAVLLAVSPWHIIFSRTALEASTSLFLYFGSWIFLTKLSVEKYRPKTSLISLLLFILLYGLGYFTYHGYKFSLPLLTGIIILWQYKGLVNKNIKRLLLFSAFFIFVLIARTVIYSDQYVSRNSELIFFNTVKYQDSINLDRRQSLAPRALRYLYSNKPVKLLEQLRDKYLDVANLDMLYIHGEANGAFSLWKVGYLYLLTLPFLLLGLAEMLTSGNKTQLLILTLLLISPVASVIHVNNSLVFRSGIYFILLNIVTAYGLVSAYEYVSTFKPKLKWSLYAVFVVISLVQVVHFSYVYFYVFPVANANSYFFSDRIIGNYLRLSTDSKTLIIATQPRYLKSASVLVNRDMTKDHITGFNSSYSPIEADIYQSSQLTIMRDCPKGDEELYDTVILEVNSLDSLKECAPVKRLLADPQLSTASIVSVVDSGDQYKILGDRLCNDYNLSQYVHPDSLSDFKLEQMDATKFCQTWIVRR
jgi:hypothetical protein